MSIDFQHERIRDLLGAFAVNAVDDHEHALVTDHIDSCDDCRNEIDELLRSAGLLGSGPAVQPEDVWQRIQSEIVAPAPQRLRIPEAGSKKPEKRKHFRWIASAAAAVLLVAGTSVVVGERIGSPEITKQQVALQSVETDGSSTIVMASSADESRAKVVLLPDGRGYILESNLPKLAANKTYQLWALMGPNAISAGILGPDPSFSSFTTVGNVTAFAITEEVAGGVVASHNQPVLTGVVQTT